MINNNQTSRARLVRRALFTTLAGAVLLVAPPRAADTSSFAINLLNGSSGGRGGRGGGSGDVASGVFGLGARSTGGMTSLTLGAPPSPGPQLLTRSVDLPSLNRASAAEGLSLTTDRFAEAPERVTARLESTYDPIDSATGGLPGVSRITSGRQENGHDIAAVGTGASSHIEAIAHLDLGHGEYLAVSAPVGQSLIGSVSRRAPVTAAGEAQVLALFGFSDPAVERNPANSGHLGTAGTPGSSVSARGNAPLSALAQTILSSTALDLVSSPGVGIAGPSDTTSSGPSVAATAVPEAGSLVLFGSGLALAAQFLRRRKGTR